MLKEERIREILEILKDRRLVKVPDLEEKFDVSAMTVRRDLMELEKRGKIERFHGGAKWIPDKQNHTEPPIIDRMNQMAEEKKRIAEEVVNMIEENETIFLGSGSTTFYVARELIIRDDITVVTNSVPILHELSNNSNMNIITVGGFLRRSELSLIGAFAEHVLRNIRVHKVIIGIRGIHPIYGLTCDHPEELVTDQQVLKISDHILIVADHTKIGQVATNRVTSIETVDKIITTKKAREDMVRNIRAKGIEMILV